MSDPANGNGNPPADNKQGQIDYSSELKKLTETLTSQITNLKGELNRKVGNLESRFNPPQPEPKDEPLEDLIYTNPKKVIETIRKQATDAAVGVVADSQRKATEIGNMVYDYPELQDRNSDFFKAAVKVFEGMSSEEQANPMAMKLAVKEAAIDAGLKPRSKRDTSDDDFYMEGGNGAPRSNRRNREPELQDTTLILAEKMGLNTSDPKVLESLKARSKRTNWNRYE